MAFFILLKNVSSICNKGNERGYKNIMAEQQKKTVVINNSLRIPASFSFETSYDPSSNPPLVVIEGVLSYDGDYLENITSIESERYLLKDVRVYKEAYGSDENTILYYFTAKSYGLSKKVNK